MEFKKEALYAKTHEWVIFDGDTAIIGISDFAQSELGDLVFVNLPEEGDDVVAGEAFADVESVKAVSDIYSPVTGVVAEINEGLLDAPEMINDDAFGAWFIKVSDVTDKSELISAEEYEAFCESEEE
ncbi:MAG: glycine cleavage system protein GcvH [Bacillota bacterium]|nr:glycine cleavage system protein GcvH [Bacillota bacterium]